MAPLFAAFVLVVGATLGVPGIVALGVVGLGLGLARLAWRRAGSGIVSYQRRLATDRAVCGDPIELEVAVANRGPLPLPWVRTVDGLGTGVAVEAVTERGPEGAEAASEAGPTRGLLVGGWSLGPFKARTRRYRIRTDRRGAFELGPVSVVAGDLVGAALQTHEHPERVHYLVRPRMVAVRDVGGPRDWAGERRAERGLADDPSRPAGVRPYQPGDPLRRIHWRATARVGQVLTRRVDPSRRRDVLLALDLRVPDGGGPADRDELTEGLVIAAMSLARRLHEDGAAVGLAVAGFSRAGRRHLFLPPNATGPGLGLLADVLARLDAVPTMAFADLLGESARRLAPGTTIVALGAVDPVDTISALRRLQLAGFGVMHVAFGPDAPAATARVAATGIPARAARLDGPWATSTRLELAG